MDFGLTLEQKQFDDSLRAFLADHLPMNRLRALAEDGSGYDETLWRNLADLGLHGLLIPEHADYATAIGAARTALKIQNHCL